MSTGSSSTDGALRQVVYVDDEHDIRTVVQLALETLGGLQVTLCGSGAEALRQMSVTVPDLLLLDVMMPGMDGPATLRQLQQRPGGLPCPVLFVTAKAQPEEVAQLRALGALDVIAKPFDVMTLAQTLRSIWAGRQPLPPEPQTEVPLELAIRLEALRGRFLGELPQRLTQLRSLWQRLVQQWQPPLLADLHRGAHSLTGAGATFGLAQLTASARQLELLCKAQLDVNPPSPSLLPAIAHGLAELERAMADVGAVPAMANEMPAALVVTAASEEQMPPLVQWLGDGAGDELARQLTGFGYRLQNSGDVAGLSSAASAVVVDLDCMPLNAQTASALAACRVPVLAVASAQDFASRLAAVRAGMVGYFCRPVDLLALVAALDHHSRRVPEPPYRVLLVDDERAVADYHVAVMEQAGMRVTSVQAAAAVPEAIDACSPDLVLADLYMPGASGVELAMVLRQQERYNDIPIVFLSSERDIDAQLSALGMGADDFLVKPVSPERLISSLRARAQRARALRAAMTHDGLTGLLNHKSIKSLLEKEFARAERSGRPLSLVLLDVDHFKRINDEHGHPVGDRVLRALARLLRQRLRQSDHLGRYGGEEFLIVLPETPGEAAQAVAEQLRAAFAALPQTSERGSFSATFSAGIAVVTGHDSASTLLNAADQALYAAKRAGRNCVRVAPPAGAGPELAASRGSGVD